MLPILLFGNQFLTYKEGVKVPSTPGTLGVSPPACQAARLRGQEALSLGSVWCARRMHLRANVCMHVCDQRL